MANHDPDKQFPANLTKARKAALEGEGIVLKGEVRPINLPEGGVDGPGFDADVWIRGQMLAEILVWQWENKRLSAKAACDALGWSYSSYKRYKDDPEVVALAIDQTADTFDVLVEQTRQELLPVFQTLYNLARNEGEPATALRAIRYMVELVQKHQQLKKVQLEAKAHPSQNRRLVETLSRFGYEFTETSITRSVRPVSDTEDPSDIEAPH